jgi:hypothetical protein
MLVIYYGIVMIIIIDSKGICEVNADKMLISGKKIKKTSYGSET